MAHSYADPGACARAEGSDLKSTVSYSDRTLAHIPQPTLRPYQQQVVDRFRAEIGAGRRRVLVEAPTASGKTVMAADIVAGEVRQGRRVLFLAHRRELIKQASRKLHAAGCDHGIILAGYPARPAEPVQVASIATLHARAIRRSLSDLPPADLVLVDEAHHAPARTYHRIIESYPEAVILGITATPCRGDGRGLGAHFDVMVRCADVAELTRAGYLVPAIIYAPTRPNLTGVRVKRGDYVETQLADRMDRPQLVGDVVEHWLRLGQRRRTIVFATGVSHSVHLRDEFRRAGILAEHIDGGTPTEERDAILARLEKGRVEIVVNVGVLAEGFDAPDVGCLILARPTKSLGLYRQMVGRALRVAPGKTDAIILDHAGAVFEHGFPDDPVEWTLREDRRAENRAHTSRGTPQARGLTTCPECHAVRFEGRPCAVCGWRPVVKAKAVQVTEGDLARIDHDQRPDPVPMDQGVFYAELLGIALQYKYQRGWAAHKFKEKFGRWPSRLWKTPARPTEPTLAWVRSRNIAYAKARQKRGAA